MTDRTRIDGTIGGNVTTGGALAVFGLVCGRLEVENDAPRCTWR